MTRKRAFEIGERIGAVVVGLFTFIVSVGLLLLIAAAVVGRYGVRVPYVPAVNVTELCYLAGAWFLYRGGRIT